MHVGVFLGKFEPEVGGGYTFVNDVIEAFFAIAAESHHQFSLFSSQHAAASLRGRDLPPNVTIVGLAEPGNAGRAIATLKYVVPIFGYFWRWPSALERAALARRVELMWFVGVSFDTVDMPYIATVWDVQHLTHPWFPEVSSEWRWEYRELFLQRHLRRAMAVITGTEVGRTELVSFYSLPRDRIYTLPHPTPSFALSATTADDAGVIEKFKLGKDFLIYPAQFWAHKNHINLLLALKSLSDAGQPVPDLALVGSDKGNKDFVKRKAAELGFSARVHFLGFVARAELIALYRHAGALVYPSFSGPENLPPLEAFALGCPVVASDFPGAREQLGEAALLFDPKNPAAMAQAIVQAREPDIRADIVRRGHERAKSWTGLNFAREVVRILDDLEPVRRAWA